MTFTFTHTLLLLAAGSFAGVLSGLLGLGGMSVYVPLLLWIFHPRYPQLQDLIPVVLMNSFCVVLLVGFASWWAHQAQGNIHYGKFRPLAFGAFVGATSGFSLAKQLGLLASMDLLFGAYLVFVGFLSLVQRLNESGCEASGFTLFRIGLAGGSMGGFIGFNGNSVFIPLLRKSGLNVKQSMATGNLIGLVVSMVLIGMLGYAFSYQAIDASLCLVLAMGGFAGSHFGAYIKRRASLNQLNITFAAACWSAGAILLTRVAH